ncbi:MAG: glycosyl hydrolase 53 family protein [Tepidisphaeraceae bacterium]
MTSRIHAVVIFLLCLTTLGRAEPSAKPSEKLGVDANYAADMAAKGKSWTSAGKAVDPIQTLGRGAGHFRVRLWVGENGFNQLKYATETARRAQAAGMKPMVVLFLSEDWADFVKQPVPKVWAKLGQGEKLAAIEAYAEQIAKHFAAEKIDVDTFEIGNEIDFGICGVFEEKWANRVSVDYMRAQDLAGHGADHQGGASGCIESVAEREIRTTSCAVE